jgi:simple sugar transport system permease protein
VNTSPTIAARLTTILRKPLFWGLVAIVLLLAVNVLKDPTYLSVRVNPTTGNLAGNLLDILRTASPVLMLAIGMSLVIATGGIDLSVGSVMAVSGAVSMQYLRNVNEPKSVSAALLAIGMSLAIGATIGVISGLLVAYVGLQPFITTLVMMLAGRGLAKVITSGQNTSSTNEHFRWIANGYVFGFPVVFLIAVALAVIAIIVVRRSALGMMIVSIGINPKASRMAGIKPAGLLITVYAVCAVLASIAGIFSVSSVMTVDVSQTGYQMELDAILAVVVGGGSLAGGKLSMGGAAVGALLIATLDKTVVFLGVPSSATPAFKAVVILVLFLLQADRVRNLIRFRRGPQAAVPELTEPKASVAA